MADLAATAVEASMPRAKSTSPAPATIAAMQNLAHAPLVPIPKRGVDYRKKVVLAPMVRSGELPTRLVALKHGADLVWETIDRAIIGCIVRHNERTGTVEFSRISSQGGRSADTPGKESIIFRIHPERESSRLVYQMGTANPELAVQAARIVAPYVAGIDVNSGCPKPFSTGGGMGAALLSTPDLLCSILTSLVEVGREYDIGVSVKIRLLPTREETAALVRRLVKTGITGLTLHCRTRVMRKTEKAIRDDLVMVGEICKEAGVACLMNGDVVTRQEAEQLAQDFKVDGAMIATAAEKNPSVFRPEGPLDPIGVARELFEEALAVENKWGNTKFVLAQILPGKHQARTNMSQAKNYADMAARIWPGDAELAARGAALDALLGIEERMICSEAKKHNQKQNQKQNHKQSLKRAAQGGAAGGDAGGDVKRAKAADETPLADLPPAQPEQPQARAIAA